MIVFPQLSTGASGQYPLVRRRQVRRAMNYLRDGTVLNFADPSYAIDQWELALRDLTDAEAAALQTLFNDAEGRRGTFMFVDPTANLLAHSEDLTKPCWTVGPLVQFSAGLADPLGGRRAMGVTNASQTIQTVSQMLPAPAWFAYAFSVYARSAGDGNVTLTRSTSGNAHSRRYGLGSSWTRCVLSGALNTTATSVSFGLEIEPAASIEIFGIQVEAQPCASAYKRTGSRNGVYSAARFEDDVLRQTSDGPDQHRFQLRITAKD